MSSPLISLALPIKNGLPGLPRTLEALRRQTYRHFEVIVQDGGSTDGSLDIVRTAGLPHVDIVSEPDTGIAQAYNRAYARCRGPLVAALACDEYLEDYALETFVRWFEAHPNAAVCYGRSRLWKSDTEMHSVARAGKWDYLRFMRSEYVPPAGAACFNREVIGRDFYYDETLKSVPDFDFFLRLGLRFGRLEIIEKDEVVQNSMRNATSYICRPENYDQVLQDIAYILNRFFVAQGNSRLNQHLHRQCLAGAYCTYASHVLEFDGETPQLYRYLMEAAKYDPASDRVAELAGMLRGVTHDPATGQVFPLDSVQPATVPTDAAVADGAIDLSTRTESVWQGADTAPIESGVRVTTGSAPWSYAALVPVRLPDGGADARWYWVEASVRVQAGQVGIGVLNARGPLRGERLLPPGETVVELVFPFTGDDVGLLVRNGSLPQPSVVALVSARVRWAPSAASSPAMRNEGDVVNP